MQFCPVNKEDYEKLYRLIIEETKKRPYRCLHKFINHAANEYLTGNETHFHILRRLFITEHAFHA